MTTRFFESPEAARLYAQGRPYFHPLVMERVREMASLERLLEQGIDVGCGTGLSTVALRLLAKSVLGTDVSDAMIRAAKGAYFAVAKAESLPVVSESQDILTISSAFHWVDPLAFLTEARRVLRPEGLLVVYENGFYGEMAGVPEFARWSKEGHLARFPSPPRRPQFSLESAPDGFEALGSERYGNTVQLSPETLVDYLLTQSNAIAAVESGTTTYEEARNWLTNETAPFFKGPEADFAFGGSIHILRRR